MRMVKVYCPPGKEAPLYAFMDALEPKLRSKLLWQILRLKYLAACELREPHFKHFALEKYEMLYELREKGRVLVRIVFAVRDGDSMPGGRRHGRYSTWQKRSGAKRRLRTEV